MRPRPINAYLVIHYFVVLSAASRDKYREYVPTDIKSNSVLSKEPTCDELRAMWRFSKRQSRAAEITNEIPTYRDPFAYNVWEDYARPRSAGRGRLHRPVYGKIVHTVQVPRIQDTTPERIRAFEEVARLFGNHVSSPPAKVQAPRRKTSFRLGGGMAGPISLQVGSFQHLKELIKSERARELQEQRMTEEAEREAVLKDVLTDINYARMMEERMRAESNYKAEAERVKVPREGLINFPDIYAPSNYEEDIGEPMEYRSRPYPVESNVMDSSWTW